MTLEQFINNNLGTRVEFDGVYPYQCVDLTKAYNRDVIGAPVIMGNAKDYAKNPLPDFYEYKINHLWYIPPRGAIAIWNGNVGGGYGHVAIVKDADIRNFKSFDQNWPAGESCVIVNHDYKNVVGFLVPKIFQQASKYNELRNKISDLLVQYPAVAYLTTTPATSSSFSLK